MYIHMLMHRMLRVCNITFIHTINSRAAQTIHNPRSATTLYCLLSPTRGDVGHLGAAAKFAHLSLCKLPSAGKAGHNRLFMPHAAHTTALMSSHRVFSDTQIGLHSTNIYCRRSRTGGETALKSFTTRRGDAHATDEILSSEV